ncbi:hypothetical protein IFM89_025164 [Coptis chinensis]|uniref:Protein TIC 40, chloroplastic n=1 Tax=Coptis chinensis TaxID=261450 RepID=A0A835HPD5_9MAGN|nr:hypothetical protein IFM89_025164 [Coptis chinensis]
MEASALISTPKLLLGSPNYSNLNALIPIRRRSSFLSTQPNLSRSSKPGFLIARKTSTIFASISSSSGNGTSSSVGVRPDIYVPPPSSSSSTIGSPLFWIGIGVGLSALFSWVVTNLKKYAMQQAFKTMMGQMPSENNPFSNTPFGKSAFSQGTPFPYTNPTMSPPTTSSSSPSQSVVTVDVPATKVEAAPATEINTKTEVKEESKRYGIVWTFVDVSPEEMVQKEPFKSPDEFKETSPPKDDHIAEEVYQNGAAVMRDTGSYNEQSNSNRKAGSVLSVEALEKMMEDPTVQKMVFPAFRPGFMSVLYKQACLLFTRGDEESNYFQMDASKSTVPSTAGRYAVCTLLNNMGGSGEWDNKMMESLKNFDLSSPEVKQQFDQIGLTPEEVISKIMANPEIAVAFQNPRVQAAIMDCSQNPLSIAKYQNDKEQLFFSFWLLAILCSASHHEDLLAVMADILVHNEFLGELEYSNVAIFNGPIE